MATLTSANSVYMLIIPLLFPVPQQLQQFAADEMFGTDPVDPVETTMGVDGYLSGGWTPQPKMQNITLQGNSPSNLLFDTWFQAQETTRDAYEAQAMITIPSLSRTYVCTKGFLTNYMPMADARKILQPRRFRITWQSILGAEL